MDYALETMDRLYELYKHHIDRLRADIAKTNRSLGSSEPEKTNLEILSRSEFEALLKQPTDDTDVTRLWVKRIIRGHELQFPELEVA